MNEVKDDTETLLRWQSVGGGALPFNARRRGRKPVRVQPVQKRLQKFAIKNSI